MWTVLLLFIIALILVAPFAAGIALIAHVTWTSHGGPTCRQCTYNLTGSMGSQRCPECGANLAAHDAIIPPWTPGRRTWMVMLGLGLMFIVAPIWFMSLRHAFVWALRLTTS